nr:hypothetical protein [Gemmatimonadaceae bacterium]
PDAFALTLNPAVVRRTLSGAAAILSNTDRAARRLAERHPELAGRVRVVPNGTDGPCDPPRVPDPEMPFRIVHAGTLYMDRDPRPLLEAAARVHETTGRRLEIVFAGPRAFIDGAPLRTWAEAAGLGDALIEIPWCDRSEAIRLQSSADVLVAFQGAAVDQIPAKVFEYLGRAATVLALTGRDSATGDLLRDSSAIVCDIDDTTAIERALRSCVSANAEGRPIVPVNADGRFSRSTQGGIVADLLETLAEAVTGPR